jgi:hypothetical protein
LGGRVIFFGQPNMKNGRLTFIQKLKDSCAPSDAEGPRQPFDQRGPCFAAGSSAVIGALFLGLLSAHR